MGIFSFVPIVANEDPEEFIFPLSHLSRLDYVHSEGKYDLHIQASVYSRDNGQFQCSIREPETGEQLVLRTFQVTVLVAPGPPNVYPSQPVVVEGAEIELTCASQGGSPDPQIKSVLFPSGEGFKRGSEKIQPLFISIIRFGRERQGE